MYLFTYFNPFLSKILFEGWHLFSIWGICHLLVQLDHQYSTFCFLQDLTKIHIFLLKKILIKGHSFDTCQKQFFINLSSQQKVFASTLDMRKLFYFIYLSIVVSNSLKAIIFFFIYFLYLLTTNRLSHQFIDCANIFILFFVSILVFFIKEVGVPGGCKTCRLPFFLSWYWKIRKRGTKVGLQTLVGSFSTT